MGWASNGCCLIAVMPPHLLFDSWWAKLQLQSPHHHMGATEWIMEERTGSKKKKLKWFMDIVYDVVTRRRTRTLMSWLLLKVLEISSLSCAKQTLFAPLIIVQQVRQNYCSRTTLSAGSGDVLIHYHRKILWESLLECLKPEESAIDLMRWWVQVAIIEMSRMVCESQGWERSI